jgi:hypothetical protein
MQHSILVERIEGMYRWAEAGPSEVWFTLSRFGVRGWLAAAIGAASAFLVLGVPSVIIDNSYFIRMIPVRTQDYVIWLITSVLFGLVLGTFAIPSVKGNSGKVFGSGILSFLAVGCPICNKLVVLLLGVSGALAFFEPLQLYLGIGSIALLIWTLALRARSFYGACTL